MPRLALAVVLLLAAGCACHTTWFHRCSPTKSRTWRASPRTSRPEWLFGFDPVLDVFQDQHVKSEAAVLAAADLSRQPLDDQTLPLPGGGFLGVLETHLVGVGQLPGRGAGRLQVKQSSKESHGLSLLRKRQNLVNDDGEDRPWNVRTLLLRKLLDQLPPNFDLPVAGDEPIDALAGDVPGRKSWLWILEQRCQLKNGGADIWVLKIHITPFRRGSVAPAPLPY